MEPKQKVLIVDDEPRNQRIIIETLDELVEFKTASSGEEALGLMQTFGPDLVLLDIMMPGIDGYEVCKRIRQNSANQLVKVILISGKAMVEERLHGYSIGADDYLTKPFVGEELIAKVKVFLRLSLVERILLSSNENLRKKVVERTEMLTTAEEKLVHAAKMSALGEMAGGIAHEVNTPLCTLSLIFDQIQVQLQKETIDRASVSRMSEIASETIKRIAKTIQGLRSFSRNGSTDPLVSTPVESIVTSTLSLCQEKLKNQQVDFKMDQPLPAFSIHCRSVEICQVLLNLIGNACDAAQESPEKWVSLHVYQDQDRIKIAVQDSGCGIPSAVKERIFQPFFTTKAVGKGTGLGLSISEGIMESHGGTIVLSEENGRTCFTLSFPVMVENEFTALG